MSLHGHVFRRLDARLEGKRVPVWNGELYLEYHRGTYTTQSRNKRANRKSEALYHTAELYSSLAGLLGVAVPREQLAEGWKLILLNQFHDIIPGSSIGEVYVDSAEDYKAVASLGQGVLASSIDKIASSVNLPGSERALLVFNPTGFARTDVVAAPLPAELAGGCVVVDAKGLAVVSQLAKSADGAAELVFEAVDVPANGYAAYRVSAGKPAATSTLQVADRTFENGLYRAEFSARGALVSLFDKQAAREVLASGRIGNDFQTFEDKPMNFEAWDIDIYYQDKMLPLDDETSVEVVESGPVRATLLVKRAFSHSTITQRIQFYAQTPRIDFVTEVDWHEKHTLLKVAFPVDIRATEATFDIQFGNVQRPTHWNTSWDWARFETCAQKWVDLSEGDYGVSLLNDCKYGHDVKDNVIRLSLLRSPTSPDEHADEGLHSFTYSLFPHQGSWRSGTVAEAYGLNHPLIARWEQPHAGTLPATLSLVSVDRPGVVIETVKPAEVGDEIVVRAYEAYNERGPAKLTFARPVVAAEEVNLLEERVASVDHSGNEIGFAVKPYQIRSFKVKLG